MTVQEDQVFLENALPLFPPPLSLGEIAAVAEHHVRFL